MKEEKRHQMMQNLFGDQSEEEEEEEEEEVDSEHESNHHRPNYLSDDNEAVEQVEQEVEGEPYGEGQGEAEDGYHEGEVEVGESEGEREQSSQEVDVDVAEHQDESDARETDTDEKDDYSQRVVTSRRRDVVDSGSEHSEEQEPRYIDPEDDEEVGQLRSQGGSPEEERNQPNLAHSAAEIRDVFGDSDEEEPTEYGAQHDMEQEPKYPLEEEESYEKDLRPDELVRDEDAMFGSEEEIDNKPREKPLGPPMELEIPLRPPPAQSDKMNLIRVSNIMGIDPKPFDPKTYVEEDVFVTDESGVKKRIRLENNIVRWRTVKKADGSLAYESNARFVRWSDGSIQLQIGNEVLDISVQDAKHDNAYLFLRHGKGILQSQGKLLKKMRFMPSSLSSNSHRLLTALVDSRHKKVYKVKNCITDVDPEKEKEKKERAESQTIRANSTLARKREKVNRRYTRPSDRGRQLSPGFLEDALEEDDEANYYDSRRSGSRRHFEDELEAEARAEKRIINAKKGQLKDIPRKSSAGLKTSQRPVDFSDSDKEGSYYETDGEEEEAPERPYEDSEPEWQDSEDDVEPEEQAPQGGASDEEAEEPKHTVKEAGSSLKRKEYESDEESPRKKPTTHRRMAVVYDSDEE
ncbi:protein LEO1 homolog [Silene latifolia]|uniref:protein LEO1 homolog n=1 Tax=Silene latifolia TaxID=37657 RepID=UPI003D780616